MASLYQAMEAASASVLDGADADVADALAHAPVDSAAWRGREAVFALARELCAFQGPLPGSTQVAQAPSFLAQQFRTARNSSAMEWMRALSFVDSKRPFTLGADLCLKSSRDLDVACEVSASATDCFKRPGWLVGPLL